MISLSYAEKHITIFSVYSTTLRDCFLILYICRITCSECRHRSLPMQVATHFHITRYEWHPGTERKKSRPRPGSYLGPLVQRPLSLTIATAKSAKYVYLTLRFEEYLPILTRRPGQQKQNSGAKKLGSKKV